MPRNQGADAVSRAKAEEIMAKHPAALAYYQRCVQAIPSDTMVKIPLKNLQQLTDALSAINALSGYASSADLGAIAREALGLTDVTLSYG